MDSIVLPEIVILRLVQADGHPLLIPNVLFNVHAQARRKNDFDLGPFATDDVGIVTITKSDLLAEAAAHYDSGLMDYNRLEECKAEVTILPMTATEIETALQSRIKVWTTLLRGEQQRWASIEELRLVYRTAANRFVKAESVKAYWDGKANEYEYSISAENRM